jgi:hypothetical protein
MLVNGPGRRWIFLVNVPIGAAVRIAALRYLPADRPPRRRQRFDVVGAVTSTVGVGLLAYGVLDATTIVVPLAAVLLLGYFPLHEVWIARDLLVVARRAQTRWHAPSCRQPRQRTGSGVRYDDYARIERFLEFLVVPAVVQLGPWDAGLVPFLFQKIRVRPIDVAASGPIVGYRHATGGCEHVPIKGSVPRQVPFVVFWVVPEIAHRKQRYRVSLGDGSVMRTQRVEPPTPGRIQPWRHASRSRHWSSVRKSS